jgi:hypothetical protein
MRDLEYMTVEGLKREIAKDIILSHAKKLAKTVAIDSFCAGGLWVGAYVSMMRDNPAIRTFGLGLSVVALKTSYDALKPTITAVRELYRKIRHFDAYVNSNEQEIEALMHSKKYVTMYLIVSRDIFADTKKIFRNMEEPVAWSVVAGKRAPSYN